jgi:hypothetical protein
VNGVGLVTFASNLGAFFIPDQIEPPDVPPFPTTVELIAPPSEAVYGTRLPLAARLTSDGSPLAGRLIEFRLGALQACAHSTPTAWRSSASTLLRPGLHTLPPCSLAHRSRPGRDRIPVPPAPQPHCLTLTPSPSVVAPDDPLTLVATLTDQTGRPLPEQTVIFVVEGLGTTRVVTAITDSTAGACSAPWTSPMVLTG